MYVLSPTVTPPSDVAGSSGAASTNPPISTTKKPEDSKKNRPKRPKPEEDSGKKPPKWPKPDDSPKWPAKPAGHKPADKMPKKSKNSGPLKQPSTTMPSLPTLTWNHPTTSFPFLPQINPLQLVPPTAPLQLAPPTAPLQLAPPTAPLQLSPPTAPVQLSPPAATQGQVLPTDSQRKQVNTGKGIKGKNTGGNNFERLMCFFVKPEYRVDKTADGSYRCSITHPLFNSVMGNKHKTEETAKQSAANKVIKHLNEKHNFKIPPNN